MTEMPNRPAGHVDEPSPDRSGPDLPRLGLRGTARFLWTQLTSMRTALVLLFALAVAAVPGSLIPQRPISPIRVNDFIAAHPTLGQLYDRLGLFSVYTSPWFSAVYLLLFVSLCGCIVPRIRVYTRALRAQPPLTPRNLARLPAYTRRTGTAPTAEDVLDRAAQELRRQRYRTRVVEGPQGRSISAERGYLREAGNLVFHTSLLAALLGVAIGALWGYRGSSVVIVGQGFSNSIIQFDDFSAGGWFRSAQLRPFTIKLNDFRVRFETGPVQTGAARLFEADIEVSDPSSAQTRLETLKVNRPSRIGGATVHLIGHGYTPIVTVKDGQGNVAFSGPVVFLPQDGNFTSAGVIKAPDAQPQRLAFEGFFLPSALVDDQGPRSVFPDAFNPQLFINVWSGPPAKETGKPENVYSLDTTGLTQVRNDKGDILRIAMSPGQGVDLPDGLGSIQLDGWNRWVKLQVSDTPGALIALSAIAAGTTGLCLSLFIRPRRVWVRVTRAANASSDLLIEVGGLDRADARGGLSDDVDDLATALAEGPK